jgi:hypothetical protein
MIDRQKLLADLKPLLRELEADLRARCDEVPQTDIGLKAEYEQARAANRTGVTYEEWRADLITQVAVAWVLSCVFVRFLEDNELTAPPRISGSLHGACTGAGLQRARDEREAYFRSHPKQTDRDYLLAVFDDLAKLPGTKDVFGSHNVALAYRNWLSGDAAQKLIEFFQKIDTDGTGELIHDFIDEAWDTRFLGDLYQDLSEAARKKYALLQTPIFVEEFILERTLEPAINEFGLAGLKMIDPACGSGHFLLGSFARILAHWRKAEPAASDRELVNRSLASVHGVDLNPYAVAIARFRLLLAAMAECHIKRLKDTPAFAFNLACGDSLLHGSGNGQQMMDFHELAHHYQSENVDELRRILKQGQYHIVVANPPYITVKDKGLNELYREHYPGVCHMKYSLSAPFMQRLFDLACDGGFVGQITSNSFMKREFGRKLVESFLPKLDLNFILDSSGAYIPGHGTPTVILFGRHRPPVSEKVRIVMGIRGEPSDPPDPAHGRVWSSLVDLVDQPGAQNEFVSVADQSRAALAKHPWNIGGGGVVELKQQLDDAAAKVLRDFVVTIGPASFAGLDEVFVASPGVFDRHRVTPDCQHEFAGGDQLRDWAIQPVERCFTPYSADGEPLAYDPTAHWGRYLWPLRTSLESVTSFGGKTRKDLGDTWWTWYRWIPERVAARDRLVFPFVASHLHFAVDRQQHVFNRSIPVLMLKDGLPKPTRYAILAVLNSSTACFWMKQVSQQKQLTGGDGVRVETRSTVPYEFSATQMESIPLPAGALMGDLQAHLATLAELATHLAERQVQLSADEAVRNATAANRPISDVWREYQEERTTLRSQIIRVQEEIDYALYGAFGLIQDSTITSLSSLTPAAPLEAGCRPFEILSGRNEDDFPVPPAVPSDWAADLQTLWRQRIEWLRTSSSLQLIEDAHYKRRWMGRQGLFNHTRNSDELIAACEQWMLQRVESYFDLDGRMNPSTGSGHATPQATSRGDLHQPRLTSVAKVADLARADKDFMQVAEVFTGRMDFDVGALVGELVMAESVPALPVLRYKFAALDKRAAWERTWELQRLEDAVDAVFDVKRLAKIGPGKAEQALGPLVAALRIEEQVKSQVLREAVAAAGYSAEAVKQKLNLDSDLIAKPVTDAAKRAKKAAVGDIPVPPKYTSADFHSGNYWRLRGKLDVPKERWVSFPHCEGEDAALVVAWAGYDHLQLARAIAERYELAKEQEGRKLVPLLAAIGQLIPWLKQWHNEPDMAFGGTRMGNYFEEYLAQEAKSLNMSVEQVLAWQPPAKANGRGRRRSRTSGETHEQ